MDIQDNAMPREIISIDSDDSEDEQDDVILSSDSEGPDDRRSPFYVDLSTSDADVPAANLFGIENAHTNVEPSYVASEAEAVAIDPESLYADCLNRVLEIFPDICRDHARNLYDSQMAILGTQPLAGSDGPLSVAIIQQILESKDEYPKETAKKKKKKRKRSLIEDSPEDEDDHERWRSKSRPKLTIPEALDARQLFLTEFSRVPLPFIDLQLKQNGYVYSVYLTLDGLENGSNGMVGLPYTRLKAPRKKLRAPTDGISPGLLEEFGAAQRICATQQVKRKKLQLEAAAAAAEDAACVERGDVFECQCCFTDSPGSRVTSCSAGHLFCYDCARGYANSQIEVGKWKLTCMDMSQCKAEFPRSHKILFLDAKTMEALDRFEQQEALRTADLKNLVCCPFCDYAAEYPPIEEEKEFKCLNPTCEERSCRLCRLASHIPLSCAEYKKEQGLEKRHTVAEALTDAIIKKCPRCNAPTLKDGGCNKVSCTMCGCAFCDYCGKDITKDGYNHFDGNRGSSGKNKCPSHDNTEARMQQKVTDAEKKVIAAIREEYPELTENELKIKFSNAIATPAPPAALHPNIPRQHIPGARVLFNPGNVGWNNYNGEDALAHQMVGRGALPQPLMPPPRPAPLPARPRQRRAPLPALVPGTDPNRPSAVVDEQIHPDLPDRRRQHPKVPAPHDAASASADYRHARSERLANNVARRYNARTAGIGAGGPVHNAQMDGAAELRNQGNINGPVRQQDGLNEIHNTMAIHQLRRPSFIPNVAYPPPFAGGMAVPAPTFGQPPDRLNHPINTSDLFAPDLSPFPEVRARFDAIRAAVPLRDPIPRGQQRPALESQQPQNGTTQVIANAWEDDIPDARLAWPPAIRGGLPDGGYPHREEPAWMQPLPHHGGLWVGNNQHDWDTWPMPDEDFGMDL